MNMTQVLPEEIWRLVFSHLEDFHLAKSVIPVCRFFRETAYKVGFRFRGSGGDSCFDRESDSGVNLGHDWLLWYDLQPEFLQRIPTPKRLEFQLSRETLSYINEPEAIFPLGVYADRIVEGMDEDSPYFNVAQSLEERAKMVETLRTLPGLVALKIVHKSYERFSGRSVAEAAALSTRRVSPRNATSGDCPMAVADFLEQALLPVKHSLKDFWLNLACVCPRVSERRRGPDVSGKLFSIRLKRFHWWGMHRGSGFK